MKQLGLICIIFLGLFYSCKKTETKPRKLTNYVNPFIGTDGPGNTYPGATVPFGMVQLSPDIGISGWDRISGYYYQDSIISGFSHMQLKKIISSLFQVFLTKRKQLLQAIILLIC